MCSAHLVLLHAIIKRTSIEDGNDHNDREGLGKSARVTVRAFVFEYLGDLASVLLSIVEPFNLVSLVSQRVKKDEFKVTP